MKKNILLLFLACLALANRGQGQTSITMPLLDGKSPVYSRLLNADVFRLFDSTHSNGLVFIQFTVSDTGVPDNICFSTTFPVAVRLAVIESIRATNGKWKPAMSDGQNISRTLVLPIAYQYKKNSDLTIDLSRIVDSFKMEDIHNNHIQNTEGILLPVCMTGWTVR